MLTVKGKLSIMKWQFGADEHSCKQWKHIKFVLYLRMQGIATCRYQKSTEKKNEKSNLSQTKSPSYQNPRL